MAGEGILIHLPISKRYGTEDKAVRLFQDAVDYDQVYECRCCHRFIRDTWDLALLHPNGSWESIWQRIVPTGTFVHMVTTLATWALDGVPQRPSKAIPVLYKPRRADRLVGSENEGGFEHLFAKNPRKKTYVDLAEKVNNKGEGWFGEAIKLVLETASLVTITRLEATFKALHSPQVTRTVPAHKAMVKEWILFVQELRSSSATAKHWACVAGAAYRGEDFIHFKNSLPGQLMQDLQTMDTGGAIAAYNKRTDPLAYQRPQVVKVGNIAKADKLFEQLGLEDALKRRHARLSDIESRLIWRPDHRTCRKMDDGRMSTKAGGAFSDSLLPGKRSSPPYGVQKMTMAKFMRTVMPVTRTLDLYVPIRGSFFGLTAPTIPKARALVKFHGGVAWYTYMSPTVATQWGITGTGGFRRAVGIVPFPVDWDKATPERGWMFLVETQGNPSQRPGLCLFPEFLVPEVREVRSAIEAYSNNSTLDGSLSLVALTLDPDNGGSVRVMDQGGQVYELTYD